MKQLTTLFFIFVLHFNLLGQDADSLMAKEILPPDAAPGYPGGIIEMDKFLKDNLIYPKKSKTVKGKVLVSFYVNEDGSLSDFLIVRGLGDPFDSLALDVIKKMPKWIPASNGHKSFRTKYVLPIRFDR